MVVICKDTFSQNELYQDHFNKFPFELSDFQKYSIQAILEGNHILVTAHTGSGKTLPAEFAIEHFVAQGKKVIYTSPIKALSNQKFHEFSKKFPNISFGILTGDIKFNPEADVLIMTTEILRNTLLQKNVDKKDDSNNVSLQFEMDFENELAAVVFDEIHYINDKDRGKIWEESIMFIPSHIQLIMLSATIDKSETFAKWIEDVKITDEHNKIVYLAPTDHRVVPLKHYFYTTMPQGPFKNIKDKEFIKFINEFLHKPIPAKDSKNKLHRENHEKVRKLLNYISKNNCHIKPAFVLNQLTNYLNNNNMLPAICFVFSRKGVEKLAQTINVSLFEEDSTIPSTIRYECEQILRKLPNHKEYTSLPEFEMIMKLLVKGVAIHHSGIMPIYREMIELLFAKGYIKLLFATETFAVGINMPTKTVIFTGFEKFNGSSMRMLYPHEYTQMAGRAGRRGLDTIGHVIHLSNLFSLPFAHDYELLLNGNPQTLTSKFNISYNLVLNFLQVDGNTLDFAGKSMSNGEIQKSIQSTKQQIENLKNDLIKKEINPTYEYVMSNKDNFETYIKLTDDLKSSKQKQKKQIQRTLENIANGNKHFKTQMVQFQSMLDIKNEITNNQQYLENLNNHFHNSFNNIVKFLQSFDYINSDGAIHEKGNIATYIQETHCLAFTDLLVKYNYFKEYSANEIAALLSCFANIRVKDDLKIFNTNKLTSNPQFNSLLDSLKITYENYITEELRYNIETNDSVSYMFEMVNPILEWCNSEDEQTCKSILNKCQMEYTVFPGEFIKAILKINNMVNELKSVAEYMGNIELLHKLSLIPDLTLKFVATNQSLYI
jgi:superfamily II RNA helicase